MWREEPEFGEHVVSWQTIEALVDAAPEASVDVEQWHHNDVDATEMNRLRGLVVAQAAETEAVLGVLLTRLGMSIGPQTTTGGLLKRLRDMLGSDDNHHWSDELTLLDDARTRRNRVVHDRTEIGSVWCGYATGGGEWVSVISFLGEQEVGEADLKGELALQQQATQCAVILLRELGP